MLQNKIVVHNQDGRVIKGFKFQMGLVSDLTTFDPKLIISHSLRTDSCARFGKRWDMEILERLNKRIVVRTFCNTQAQAQRSTSLK